MEFDRMYYANLEDFMFSGEDELGQMAQELADRGFPEFAEGTRAFLALLRDFKRKGEEAMFAMRPAWEPVCRWNADKQTEEDMTEALTKLARKAPEGEAPETPRADELEWKCRRCGTVRRSAASPDAKRGFESVRDAMGKNSSQGVSVHPHECADGGFGVLDFIGARKGR